MQKRGLKQEEIHNLRDEVCVCVCARARTRACVHTHTYTQTHRYTHSLTHSLTHTLTLSLSLSRARTDTHTYTHTHTHTHTQVRISQAVGSHDNIVYMKEFVENKDKYYIVLEYLTGGELFDRIVNAPHGHFTGSQCVHNEHTRNTQGTHSVLLPLMPPTGTLQVPNMCVPDVSVVHI